MALFGVEAADCMVYSEATAQRKCLHEETRKRDEKHIVGKLNFSEVRISRTVISRADDPKRVQRALPYFPGPELERETA